MISNKRDAYGLQRATTANIDTSYLNWLPHKKRHPEDVEQARSEYGTELASVVLKDKPDLVVCAGWMLILAPTFLDQLKAANVPIINLHPALPGERIMTPSLTMDLQ